MPQHRLVVARTEGRSIIAPCPFPKGQIERHRKWRDVLRRKT